MHMSVISKFGILILADPTTHSEIYLGVRISYCRVGYGFSRVQNWFI